MAEDHGFRWPSERIDWLGSPTAGVVGMQLRYSEVEATHRAVGGSHRSMPTGIASEASNDLGTSVTLWLETVAENNVMASSR